MPKVLSYTPPWLSRPSPGATVFSSTSTTTATSDERNGKKDTQYMGPTKTLAKRGNEVFVVVDNQIRWCSLTRLKDEWKQQLNTKRGQGKSDRTEEKGSKNLPEDVEGAPCRILNVPVYGQIRQLIPSPNGAFLAIISDHTVHISVLPDPSHLSSADSSPLRLKTYQLGPTTHVIPEAPVVSALWHPLGIHRNVGGCIVTVTADAAVRIWELDRNNHWSFDRPTLAVDLKKLVDGTSTDQDFTPSGFGKSKGFSADIIDMEVASACFGGSGATGDNAWAPMTLWVAMKPGDLYALCPLLPSKWQAPSTTIPSLSAAIIPKLSALEEDSLELEDELTACRQQYEWLKEIDDQEPQYPLPDRTSPSGAEILARPVNPSAIPRLQGPFRIDTGDEVDDLDLCDVYVIPAKADMEDLMVGEDEDLVEEDHADERLSATVICLSTGSGRVHVCLELDGVEGQWLPQAKKNAFRTPLSEPPDLVLAESLDTLTEDQRQLNCWPTFTGDVHSRYGVFVTTPDTVYFLSLAAWVKRLERELQSEDTSGSAFRLQVLCEGLVSLRERIFQADVIDAITPAKGSQPHLASSLLFYDYDLGYLLLTCRGPVPYAAILDVPENSFPSLAELRGFEQKGPISAEIAIPPRRPPYQVPAVLYSGSPLEFFVEKHVPHRQRHTLKEQIRLSPATLDIVAAAHRILSTHTNALERAASDLFRRCERLQGEMRDQLRQIADVADRIRGISSEIGEDGRRKEDSRSTKALDERLQAAEDRQQQLVQRYETLRNKLHNSGGRPLSEKEKAWIAEVNALKESVEKAEPVEDENGKEQKLWQRLETVKSLATDLLGEAKTVSAKQPTVVEPGIPMSPGSPARVPQRLQRAKLAEAMRMVERESAVIDAITSRLEKLNTNLE